MSKPTADLYRRRRNLAAAILVLSVIMMLSAITVALIMLAHGVQVAVIPYTVAASAYFLVAVYQFIFLRTIALEKMKDASIDALKEALTFSTGFAESLQTRINQLNEELNRYKNPQS